MIRRTLVILVTAFLVARPLVLGEDPGMQAEFTDTSGTLLTLLWLGTAALWAFWRLLARQSENVSGANVGLWGGRTAGALVEVGLLVLVGLVFLSAAVAAHYRFPARLIAWEWFGLFVAFFVIRRLAENPAEQQGLFTVLLASAASLSAHAVWQSTVELPRLQRTVAANTLTLHQALVKENPALQPDDPFVEALRRRAQESNVFSTFAHPNSFAGYLVLLLPGLVGASVLAIRLREPAWRRVLAFCLALLTGVGLWLSHSRGAQLAAILVAVVVAAIAGRHYLLRHKGIALVALAFLVLGGFAVYASGWWSSLQGKDSASAAQRIFYWKTAGKIIRERPWLGVGPGNFGNAYTRLMDPAAGETIKDPHNFALEIAADYGVFALAAMLVTLGLFFATMIRGIMASPTVGQVALEGKPQENSPRWQYYVGGMLGLLLGFAIRAGDQPSAELVWEAVAAGLRSVVWFAAFGVLGDIIWPARARALALTAGVAALLANLCVSGGIGFPSVAGPMWTCVALGLATLGGLRPIAWTKPAAERTALQAALEFVPLPLFAALALAYYTYAFDPLTSAMGLFRSSAENARNFSKLISKRDSATAQNPIQYVTKGVIRPLEEALRYEPEDARFHSVLAGWYGRLWGMEQIAGTQTPQSLERSMNAAMKHALMSQKLDPEGRQGYFAEYQLRQLYFAPLLEKRAEVSKDQTAKRDWEKAAREQHQHAAKALRRYLPNDPNDPVLRFFISIALFQAGDADDAKGEAAAALRLDREAGIRATRRLTDPQRHDLIERVGDTSAP
jgi:hypothetical protein